MRIRSAVVRAGVAAIVGLVGLGSTATLASAYNDSFVFSDVQQGWRLILEGSSYDPYDPGTAALWRTHDGGDTWQRLTARKSTLTSDGGFSPGLLAFANASRGVWGRTGYVVLRTSNAGTTWRPSSRSALKVSILNDLAAASPSLMWACGMLGSAEAGGTILRSTDGGATWTVSLRVGARPSTPDGTGGFFRISSPSSRRCYVAGDGRRLGGLWVTTDYGAHWVKRRLPDDGVRLLEFPTKLIGWYSGYSGSLYKTTDGGRSWRAQGVFAETTFDPRDASFVDASHGWLCNEYGDTVRTTDGGATWEWVNTGSGARLSEIHFVDTTHGWARGLAGDYPATWDVLLRTSDGGLTWQEL